MVVKQLEKVMLAMADTEDMVVTAVTSEEMAVMPEMVAKEETTMVSEMPVMVDTEDMVVTVVSTKEMVVKAVTVVTVATKSDMAMLVMVEMEAMVVMQVRPFFSNISICFEMTKLSDYILVTKCQLMLTWITNVKPSI